MSDIKVKANIQVIFGHTFCSFLVRNDVLWVKWANSPHTKEPVLIENRIFHHYNLFTTTPPSTFKLESWGDTDRLKLLQIAASI